jgi:hypothetical protein
MSRLILARRSFLTGLGAMLAAPAIVKADTLMRVGNINHILYPVRGLVHYQVVTDRLCVRIDRANFPINMTPRGVCKILSEKQIKLLFTDEQINAILPKDKTRKQQLTMHKDFVAQEWVEKGLFNT